MEASDTVPRESLSPLASSVQRVVELHGDDVTAAIEAVDRAVPGVGGLFGPDTSDADIRAATERVLGETGETGDEGDGRTPVAVEDAVLYVDGSSRGNPGPAGAGAVVLDADGQTLARFGRAVGSRTDNNTAEYAALLMGLVHLVGSEAAPSSLEVRIDSMTVIRDVWQGETDGETRFDAYGGPIRERLASVPVHTWTHLADHEPNPADALATVGADIAALGPGA